MKNKIPYGDETEETTEGGNKLYIPRESEQCPDCGVEHGGLHECGCDVEQCPECGGQLMMCERLGGHQIGWWALEQ